MHILLIPSWYATPDNPIRGSFFREQAHALRKAGHQVGLLVPPSKLRSFHGLKEVRRYWSRANTDLQIEDDDGVKIYRVPWWGWRESVLPWERGNLMLRVFDRYCAEVSTPDVLHGHSILYGGYLAAYIGQQRQIPAVMTEHSSNFHTRWAIMPGQQAFVHYTLKHIDQVIAVSPGMGEQLMTYASQPRPFEVIGNLVDTELFKPPAVPPPRSPFTFLAVGALRQAKGHDILIQAFGQAFKGQSVRLLIAGKGAYRAQLEALIAQLGLGDQVSLLGLQTREQVSQLLKESHVLASGSHFETFGVTLIEGMAAGRPILATRSHGPEYFIHEKIGLLVDPGDVDATASAMRDMVDHYDRYDSSFIRDECVRKFSEQAIVSQLEAVYQAAVKSR